MLFLFINTLIINEFILFLLCGGAGIHGNPCGVPDDFYGKPCSRLVPHRGWPCAGQSTVFRPLPASDSRLSVSC